MQRAVQAIAESRTDPDRVAALPCIARYGLATTRHVVRLLRAGVPAEVVAALPLEDFGLDTAGFDGGLIEQPPTTRMTTSVSGAPSPPGAPASCAALDRELERIDSGESQPLAVRRQSLDGL